MSLIYQINQNECQQIINTFECVNVDGMKYFKLKQD
jgi:hypothetical protein